MASVQVVRTMPFPSFVNDETDEQKPPSLEAALEYIDGIFRDFAALPEIHENVLDEIVDSRISHLQSLAQVDKETYNRIAPIAAENTRFLYSGAWATSWARALATRPRLESSLVVASMGVLLLTGIVAFGKHHVKIDGPSTLFASLATIVVFSAFLWAVMRFLRILAKDRFVGIRNAFVSAVLGWIAALSAINAKQSISICFAVFGWRRVI